MAITDTSDPNTMIGAPVHSTDGQKLGRIESIYYSLTAPSKGGPTLRAQTDV